MTDREKLVELLAQACDWRGRCVGCENNLPIAAACEEVVPRLFSRSIVRGKRVERWHYPRGERLAKAPDFWMPLPGAERSV